MQKGGGENVRTLSELQSIYIRTPSVPAGEEEPRGVAEWSIYFILVGIYILYYACKYCRKKRVEDAIKEMKQQSEKRGR